MYIFIQFFLAQLAERLVCWSEQEAYKDEHEMLRKYRQRCHDTNFYRKLLIGK